MSIKLLVQYLEADLEPALNNMIRVSIIYCTFDKLIIFSKIIIFSGFLAKYYCRWRSERIYYHHDYTLEGSCPCCSDIFVNIQKIFYKVLHHFCKVSCSLNIFLNLSNKFLLLIINVEYTC